MDRTSRAVVSKDFNTRHISSIELVSIDIADDNYSQKEVLQYLLFYRLLFPYGKIYMLFTGTQFLHYKVKIPHRIMNVEYAQLSICFFPSDFHELDCLLFHY